MPQKIQLSYQNAVNSTAAVQQSQMRPKTSTPQQTMGAIQRKTNQKPAKQTKEKKKGPIQAKQRPLQRTGALSKPKGNARFQQIAAAMGEQHGVDTSPLQATHNSSFPEQVNAEATIQGNKIDFAPGKDTEHHMKHEVGHYIDNAKNGVPKGDQEVNGQKVDTTREQVVDKMANEPLQRKTDPANIARSNLGTPDSFVNDSPIQLFGDPKAIGLNQKNYGNAGGRKQSEIRSDGSLTGAAPGQDPAGYNYIRYLGETHYWIRFHLVNDNVGGAGTASNLVPASQSDNQRYENDHESDLKTDDLWANSGANREFYYGVDVSFLPRPHNIATTRDQATEYFPASLSVYHARSSDGGQNWQWVHYGTQFTFQGRNSELVPSDTTGSIDVKDVANKQAIKNLLQNNKIVTSVWSGDIADWLRNNNGVVKSLVGSGPENVWNQLAFVHLPDEINDAIGEEGLTALAGMIHFGRLMSNLAELIDTCRVLTETDIALVPFLFKYSYCNHQQSNK